MQISLVIHVELIGVFLESVSQFQLNNSSEMVSHANSAVNLIERLTSSAFIFIKSFFRLINYIYNDIDLLMNLTPCALLRQLFKEK